MRFLQLSISFVVLYYLLEGVNTAPLYPTNIHIFNRRTPPSFTALWRPEVEARLHQNARRLKQLRDRLTRNKKRIRVAVRMRELEGIIGPDETARLRAMMLQLLTAPNSPQHESTDNTPLGTSAENGHLGAALEYCMFWIAAETYRTDEELRAGEAEAGKTREDIKAVKRRLKEIWESWEGLGVEEPDWREYG